MERARAHPEHGRKPINSLHEGLGVIREEYMEFEAEVFKQRADRDDADVLRELVQLAAMAMRTAEDTGLLWDGNRREPLSLATERERDDG